MSPSVDHILLWWVLLSFVVTCVLIYTEMLWMWVLGLRYGPEPLGALPSRLILCSAGSEVNRVHVVLSGFSVRWFCFVQAKCRYSCMYFLAALVLVCVDVRMVSSVYTMTWTSALAGGMSATLLCNSEMGEIFIGWGRLWSEGTWWCHMY